MFWESNYSRGERIHPYMKKTKRRLCKERTLFKAWAIQEFLVHHCCAWLMKFSTILWLKKYYINFNQNFLRSADFFRVLLRKLSSSVKRFRWLFEKSDQLFKNPASYMNSIRTSCIFFNNPWFSIWHFRWVASPMILIRKDPCGGFSSEFSLSTIVDLKPQLFTGYFRVELVPIRVIHWQRKILTLWYFGKLSFQRDLD